MELQLLLVIISALTVSGFLVDYANVLDGPLDFACPRDSSLQQIASVNDNRAEDRRWSFGCKPAVTTVSNCVWSGYVNDFDQPALYECPGDGFINGMRSVHDNGPEDRRWAFQCCTLNGHKRDHCHFTGYLNSFDGTLSYTVPDNQLIHGTNSVHENGPEDRVFAFEVCDYISTGQ